MVVVEKRVLVVDDEEIVRQSCERALTDAGYAVRTAGSGREALRACRAEPFDVMLTDLRMPDMDGIEVIRAVAKEFPEVRVVIITGYPSRESAEQAAKLGIFDYLEKPLSPGRLSEATAVALARPPRHTASALPATAPESQVAVPPEPEPCKLERAEPERVAQIPDRKAANKTIRQGVLISLGFLVGVTAAYVIAPNHALAWLVFGTAVTSGTIFGLFSDAFFAKTAGAGSGRSMAGVPLRESRAYLQTLIDGIPDVTMVIDREHRIVMANRAARRLAREGDPVSLCMTCHELSHHSDVPCQGLTEPCPLARVVETQQPVTVTHTHYDVGGNETLMEISATPVFDEAGEVVEMIEACRNIADMGGIGDPGAASAGAFQSAVEATERALLENALRTSGGNKTAAAAALGMKASTFRDKLTRYGMG